MPSCVRFRQGWEYRYSNIDIRISIYWNTEIVFEILKFKPSQIQYYTDILKFKQSQFRYYTEILKFKQSQFQYYIDILKFNPSQFRFFRNWQRFTQSLAKRSHADTRTNKLMFSTIHYTLYTKRVCIASQRRACLRIDFAIICQWLFSMLFLHRSDTLQSMRCTVIDNGKHSNGKHSDWHKSM